jgi:hypothetical protein
MVALDKDNIADKFLKLLMWLELWSVFSFRRRGLPLPQEGWTALMWSAEKGRSDCVRLLLDASADMHSKANVRAVVSVGVPSVCACWNFLFHLDS